MDQSLDKDSIAKLVANGFAVTKDGSVWINKGHVDSGKLIDFNTLTQHEISHIVFGEDSEYEAQYVEAAYGEFLEGIRDSGYLEDGEGLIDYKMSMLADEDWARLNGYTEEDMQFKLLSGDDEVDDRHNLGGKYGTKDQSNKSFYRELNRVRKIERTVNTKRRRINQYKEKNRDREKDSKYYRDLEKEAARISAEEEEKLRLSNSYDEVLQVSYDEYLARKYVSEKIGGREELSDYRVILLSVESDGSVIILHTSGDPLEKAGNEYNERVNEKNSLYGIQGRNYEKLFHPISEMEGMIRQGQIVKYESGKLFSPVAYGMNYELARLNYEERFERGIKGTLQVGLGTMRTAIGGAMLSGSGICASMSSGLCLNAVTVQMAALGASEVGFGINDMILGGSNIGSAYSSSKDTGYDFVKEYKALRTAGPTSNPSLGKELNILKGFLGENYDMMNTSSMMTGGMYGLGMAEYYVRNQRQDEFKILGNNRIFINDGTPGGTGEVKSVTVGNSRYIINKIYSPSSDSAVIKVLNRATGEVSSTVINGSTVAERALTQIGNTAGYDLVSRMNTPPKYPLVVYEPRVEALSTVNYFNNQPLINYTPIVNIESYKATERIENQLIGMGITDVDKQHLVPKIDGTVAVGKQVDKALNNNLGYTFKTFDNFDSATGTATSVKSVNLNAKSYQDGYKNINQLSNKLNNDIGKMLDFKEYRLNGVRLEAPEINQRVLHIVVDNQPLTLQQQVNLQRTLNFARINNVEVRVTINMGTGGK